jgi:pimeloyl-ACP methyl ester carboxylesterase
VPAAPRQAPDLKSGCRWIRANAVDHPEMWPSDIRFQLAIRPSRRLTLPSKTRRLPSHQLGLDQRRSDFRSTGGDRKNHSRRSRIHQMRRPCPGTVGRSQMIGVIKVMDGGLVATLHLPSHPGPHPVMIVLSGSGGGIASAIVWGEPLAALGYAVLSVAYFAMDGLPVDLVEIPLEYFKQAIDCVRAHPACDAARVGLLGHSRGGEAALLVAATYPEIKVVVAGERTSSALRTRSPARRFGLRSWRRWRSSKVPLLVDSRLTRS